MYLDDIERIELPGGFTIRIRQDEDATDPRKDFDNLSKMYISHRRYLMGDEDVNRLVDARDYGSWGEVEQALREIYEDEGGIVVLKPVYMYDHGGVALKLGPFHDPWDSGQVGFIFVTGDDARKEFDGRPLDAARLEQVERILEGEFETYDQWQRGEVYEYTIENADGDIEDSCCGFYGLD